MKGIRRSTQVLSIAISSLLLAAMPARTQVDPKVAEQCKDARDFVGCVKAFTTPAAAPDDGLGGLRSAMKQVAGRLEAGTSLANSTNTFQPVIDQLAIVESQYPDNFNVIQARRASNLFNILQQAWDTQIKAKNYELSQNMFATEDYYNCEALKLVSDLFDAAYGYSYVGFTYQKGLFGIQMCRIPRGTTLPAQKMMWAVTETLRDGAKSPQEIAAEEKAAEEAAAKEARRVELCKMEPWTRYLEENPNMKVWASANPKAAEKAKEKFINDPKNEANCGKNLYSIEVPGFKWR